MAAHFNLELDTTAPAGVSVVVNGGDGATSSRDVTLTIGTSDGTTVGYSMKVYGDVDDAQAPSEYRASEANAPWITYATSKSVRLSDVDGSKTVRIKIRDDVGNESAEATDAITLDTAVPVVNITSGPTATKVSKVDTFDESTFTFEVDVAVQAWKVKVVAGSGSTHDSGTQIPTAGGSLNVTGGALGAVTGQSVTINGVDLETASPGDATKVIKVFAQAAAGAQSWSL